MSAPGTRVVSGLQKVLDNRRVSLLLLDDGSYGVVMKILRTDGNAEPAAKFKSKQRGQAVVATTQIRVSPESMEALFQLYCLMRAQQPTGWQIAEAAPELNLNTPAGGGADNTGSS